MNMNSHIEVEALEAVHSDLLLAASQQHDLSQCHPYVDSFSREISIRKGLNPELHREYVSSLFQSMSLTSLSSLTKESSSLLCDQDRSIPPITHHVWVCSSINPAPPDEAFLARALESISFFPDSYKHYFWVSSGLAKNPDFSERISSSGMILAEIEDLLLDDLYGARIAYWCFMKDRKYAFASDIARALVLFRHGGIYMDLGLKLLVDPMQIPGIVDATYLLLYWQNMFFQNSLMGIASKSYVLLRFLEQFNCNHNFVSRFGIKHLSGESEGWVVGGPQLTRLLLENLEASTANDNLPKDKYIILPANKKCVNWKSQQSWYKKQADGGGLYGSCFVPDSDPTYFAI